MGTEKRERQKANRQQRLVEEARAERSGAIKRNIARWIIGGVAALGAVVLIAWVGGAFSGDDDGDVDSATTEPPSVATVPLDTTPVDTTPVETFPVPPKPEVELPAVLPDDLMISVLQPGDGAAAADGDTVTVHYVGVLSADGTEFDNSYDRGSPFPVTLGQGRVIPGWDEGLIGAQEGSQIQLDIPADLAYGDTGSGEIIQPGDALTFVIDIMDVAAADETSG